MSHTWKSPQSIFNVGHKAVQELFNVPVQVQEKVDGSFFAFGLYSPEDASPPEYVPDYELRVRSKGAVMHVDAPEGLFKPAVAAVRARQHLLHPNWQYRSETLAKSKHNALAYERTPKDNVILFDVLTDNEEYLPYEELKKEAERIGFEVVPQLFVGEIKTAEELRKYLDTTSVLGGQKIEGVVIKPINPLYGPDKKMLFGKFVSEAFKEVHRKAWGESNPGNKDIIQKLIEQYTTPARWQKAVLRLREAGQIEDDPRDIGKIIREVAPDVLKECEDEIREALFKYAWPHIQRGLTRGLPEWYKDQLLRKQFEKEMK
jgi:hypothetical protein